MRPLDVYIIELGGTVGDIESAPFIEDMRQLRRRAGKDNFLQIHVSLIPVTQGEQKTKPTQQAIRDIRSSGLTPDLVGSLITDIEYLPTSTIETVSKERSCPFVNDSHFFRVACLRATSAGAFGISSSFSMSLIVGMRPASLVAEEHDRSKTHYGSQ